MTLEPLDNDSLDAADDRDGPQARGSGVLLALLARKSARKVIPQDHRKLRENLERGT